MEDPDQLASVVANYGNVVRPEKLEKQSNTVVLLQS